MPQVVAPGRSLPPRRSRTSIIIFFSFFFSFLRCSFRLRITRLRVHRLLHRPNDLAANYLGKFIDIERGMLSGARSAGSIDRSIDCQELSFASIAGGKQTFSDDFLRSSLVSHGTLFHEFHATFFSLKKRNNIFFFKYIIYKSDF